MKTTIEKITPERAADLLKKNIRNRPVTEPHVKRLSEAMARGEWRENGDAIRISSEDVLLDGQHRLMACIRSGISFQSVIVRDIDPETFETIDSGKKRCAGDVIGILGEKHRNALAGALRVLLLFEEGSLSANYCKTNTQIKDALPRYPGIQSAVSWVYSSKGVLTLLPPSICASSLYILRQFNFEKADEFYSLLGSGAGLTSGSPILALRELLIRNRLQKVVLKNHQLMLLILKAFREFYAGRNVKILRVGDDQAASLQAMFALNDMKEDVA